jgi:hypothetical protein
MQPVRNHNRRNYDVTAKELEQTQKLNENLRYVQGFRTSLPANGIVPVQINLNSPGKKLLGIAIVPASRIIDASDVLITLVVNNNNVVLNMSSANANPLECQGMIFFPIPQKLQGNDTITLTYTSNVATPMTMNCDVFYVPQ